MDSQRDVVLRRLEALLAELSKPLTLEAEADGWREQSWNRWRTIIGECVVRVKAGGELPKPGMARAMDFDGIVSGRLVDLAAEIGMLYRE